MTESPPPTGAADLAPLLLGAAETYMSTSEPESALHCISQALSSIRDSGDSAVRIRALNLQASALHKLGRTTESKKSWEQCRDLQEAANQHLGVAVTLCELGTLAKESGDWPRAREAFQRSLQFSATGAPGRERARALELLGVVDRQMGKSSDALESLSEALRIRQSINDEAEVAADHDMIGNLYAKLGKVEQAVEHYELSLRIHRKLDNRRGTAVVCNNLGSVRILQGDYDRATESFEQARELFEEFGDRKRLGWVLGNLGLLETYRGEAAGAEKLLRESLQILEEIGDRLGTAVYMNNLSPVYVMAGRYEDAIHWATRSIAVMTELGQVEMLSKPWYNIAQSHLELGHFAEAEAAALEVHRLAKTDHTVEVLAEAMLLEAAFALKREHVDEALHAAREAETLAENGGHPRPQAEAQRMQGEAHLLRGELESAREVLLSAEERFRSLTDVYHLAICRMQLGQLFLKAGASEAAASRLRLAVDVFERLTHVPLQWKALVLLGEAEWTLSRRQSRTTLASALELARNHGLHELIEETELIQQNLVARTEAAISGDAGLKHVLQLTQWVRDTEDIADLCDRILAYLRDQFPLRLAMIILDGPPSQRFGFPRTQGEPDVFAPLIKTARNDFNPQFVWTDVHSASSIAEYCATLPVLGRGARPIGHVLVQGEVATTPESQPLSKPPPILPILEAMTGLLGLGIELNAEASLQDTSHDPEIEGTPDSAGPLFEGMVGNSPAIHKVHQIVEKVAPSDASVFIYGESGTGKELIARAIHNRSSRRNASFIAISCPSIPRDLIEAELFGHEKGAFTGATIERPGQIELADGGTLFLDEIGDMDLATQTKLLRFLQEREFLRVGGRKPIHVNIRLLAATSRDLEQDILTGRFREDLFYRINVVPIKMPALRQRAGDVSRLVRHFLDEFADSQGLEKIQISPRASKMLANFSWPGNVRELRNLIEYLVAMNPGGAVREDHLPAKIHEEVQVAPEEIGGAEVSLLKNGETLEARVMSVEGSIIRETLGSCDWNQSLAARILGLKEPTMRFKMKRYGIRRPGQTKGRRRKARA